MSVFTQNSKLKKSSTRKLFITGFSLQPVKTCPHAGKCKQFCYARKGLYRTHKKNCLKHWESNFNLTRSPAGWDKIAQEIDSLCVKTEKRKQKLALRIHTEGDFYSTDYALRWFHIARCFPDVSFYAYTKSHQLIDRKTLPENFNVIASAGGKHDRKLRSWSGPIAVVFDDIPAGHVNGSHDDKIALRAHGRVKIALEQH